MYAIVIVCDGANVAFVAIWQVIKFRSNVCACACVSVVYTYVSTHRKCCFFLPLLCEANDIIAVFIVLSFIIVTRRTHRKREKIFFSSHFEGKNQLNSPHSL